MQASRTQVVCAGYFGHRQLCSGYSQHLRRSSYRQPPFRAAKGRAACRTGRPLVSKASQQAGTAISDKQKLKDEITEAAGSVNGLDRTDEQAKHIAKLLKQLESTGQLDDLDLTGSTWRLLYSTSKASSSGKIGPFIGRVTQVFPEGSRGQYVNKVDFGLVKADLLANYEKPQRDRITVAFEWIRFMLGPFSFKKDISNETPDGSL